MIKLTLQKNIELLHESAHPYLKKSAGVRTGYVGSEPLTFESVFEYDGFVNRDCKFLPHFEYTLSAHYHFSIPSQVMGGPIESFQDGIGFEMLQEHKKVILVTPSDLFQIRNLQPGQTLVKEFGTKDDILVGETNSFFFLRASSSSYGQLFATMPAQYGRAEEMIFNYLDAIDEKLYDYKSLGALFQERDAQGKVLWEDQNQQSRAYNKERKRLHTALFGELEKVLTGHDIKYRTTYR